jgi:hypothetical protein
MEETEARKKWDNWTEAGRHAFLEFHEFNPRFAHYTWPMLPYSVQQLLKESDNPVKQPTIKVKCSECGEIYHFTSMIECPRCGWGGIAWAVQQGIDGEPVDENIMSDVALDDGDKLDIAELERLFKL